MLKDTLTKYGTDNPAELFDKFSRIGSEMLRRLRNIVTNPLERKPPRAWQTTDATKMVGVSPPTFRKILENNPNLEGIVEEKTVNGRIIKKYTLQAINALRDLAKTRYLRPTKSSALVIAVSNLKGGVGKTETSVDLGKKCAIEGLRCLLLDFDAQGTATLTASGKIPDLEVEYNETITPVLLEDPSEIQDVISKTNFDGFDIIPANLAIQDCDLLLGNPDTNKQDIFGSPLARLGKSIEYIKENYDVILIDCGPNLGWLTLNAILACDGMIIPIPPNMYDYSSFVMFAGSLRDLFKSLPAKSLTYLRILLSKHPGHNESLQMENIMREHYSPYILSNHMCETIEVSKAANEMGTIYDVSKPRGSREAYKRAIQHLDDVNIEIINNFKDIWRLQAESQQSNTTALSEAI
jgi:chromosome partitioning protein